MQLAIRKMTEKNAIDILTWKYEKPYDYYSMVLTSDAILQLLKKPYHTVLDEYGVLIGFFCVGEYAQVKAGNRFHVYAADCIDVGIGLKPKLTGKGKGYEFFECILHFVQKNYPGIDIRLTVARFNERAIHLYQKMGFIERDAFHYNNRDFITMVKKV